MTPPNSQEKLRDLPRFKEFSLDEIQPLLVESEDAFLASVDNPDQTAGGLFAIFQNDPLFRIMGYEMNNMPATYITCLSNKHPETLSIGPMYVSGQCRGLGLGRRQVEGIIKLASEEGYSVLHTKTWGNNAGSRRIFEDLEFQIQKITENDRADGDSTITYWLDLRGR